MVYLPADVCKIVPVNFNLSLVNAQFLSDIVLVVAVCMAVRKLGTVPLEFYYCLCQKSLVSYHNMDLAY